MSKKRKSIQLKETNDMTDMTENSEDTLLEVRKMKDNMRDEDNTQAVFDSSTSGVIEVKELSSEIVTQKIEELVLSIVCKILDTGTFDLAIPNRSEGNQKYIESVDRNVLGDKVR
jgi:hypothetical protein